ncbi:MAG: histidine phosphatase family protein [Defluviitaleaceae bacterium]|nr:histidine phosphatase family protein [Defluviitaleaceae bacterium]
MKTIHLIRHGKTEANEKRLYCGYTDLPLSELGRLEISEIASQDIYPSDVKQLFTSGLTRTEETLDIIYGTVPRKRIPSLMEYNFGQFEMHSYEQLKAQEDYQAWIMDTTDAVACPGGESKKQFNKRIIAGFNEIMTMGETALVVCHGGVIACIMEHLWPGTKNFYEWQPAPGRGYTLHICGNSEEEGYEYGNQYHEL